MWGARAVITAHTIMQPTAAMSHAPGPPLPLRQRLATRITSSRRYAAAAMAWVTNAT